MKSYQSEIKEIKIIGVHQDGTVDKCDTTCRNFTVREDLEYLFNGKQRLVITSNIAPEYLNCERHYLLVSIDGLEGIYYKSDSFDRINYYCRQIIHYENITKFFENYYKDDFLNKMNRIKIKEVLDSPALRIRPGIGLLYSKITIIIYGMSSANSFQIRSKNTKAVDGELIE